MYVYGRNVAKELFINKTNIKNVYLVNDFKDKDLINDINKNNINITYLSKKEMDKLCDGNHQGIVLNIDDYNYLSDYDMLNNLKDNSFIVILDHIEDPHNFGAIIRTCEAAGVDYIIIPKDRSVKVNSTVMKTSCGALDNVRIVMTTNLNNIIKKLKDKGVWIVGTTLDADISYDSVDYKTSTAIVIGNEGAGMSSLVMKNCDFLVNIPMIGKINSLNASVAAGIMIYEVVRQRR